MRRISLSVLLLSLPLGACDDGASPDPVTSLTASPSTLSLGIGDTTRLSITARTASGKAVPASGVSWLSTVPSVASVSSVGTVRALAEGQTDVIATAGGLADTVAVTVLDGLSFNVSLTSCTNPSPINARVVGESQHAIVVADLDNPSGGLTDAEYQAFANDFDNIVWSTLTGTFGTPTDIDANQKVTILYTKAVNELTEEGSQSFIAGFFHPRDLFPKVDEPGFQGCAGSNAAEMFYMLVPDPNGEVNGNERSKELVLRTSVGTLAHEFQHLINASRRLRVNQVIDQSGRWWEEDWLDEGLSHAAEELVFYDVAGLGPRQNIDVDRIRSTQSIRDAFNAYVAANFGRLQDWLEDPEAETPFGDAGELSTRGAIWQFLRYAVDRHATAEQQLWFDLANPTSIDGFFGFDNLQRVLGSDVPEFFRDWAVAAFTDDHVVTTATFQHPSWNFRSIFPALRGPTGDSLGEYPLKLHALAGDTTLSLTLAGGGAGFVQFGVAPDARAELLLSSSGSGMPASCQASGPAISLVVGEVHREALGAGRSLCIDAGSAGADYVYVPYHMSEGSTATVSLQIEVSGVQSATAASIVASQSLSPVTATRFAIPLLETPLPDPALEQRLRRRWHAELAASQGMPFRTAVAPAAAATFDEVVVSVVRVR
ncbi:MAG: Ig-like domain-containing protein [Longimicrobiales bacterium]